MEARQPSAAYKRPKQSKGSSAFSPGCLQHHRTAIDPEYILTQTRSQIDIALPVRWRAPRDKLFSALSAHGQRHLAAFHWSLGQSRAPPNFSSRPTSSPYPDAHPQLALLRLPLRPLLLRAARLPATPARRLPALLVPSLPQTISHPQSLVSHRATACTSPVIFHRYCPTALLHLLCLSLVPRRLAPGPSTKHPRIRQLAPPAATASAPGSSHPSAPRPCWSPSAPADCDFARPASPNPIAAPFSRHTHTHTRTHTPILRHARTRAVARRWP